jgi:xylulokinase
VLEGVAFGLRDGLDLMIGAGMPPPAAIRASGGGTASPLWRQILADVLGVELVTVTTTEGAAYGAALLAGAGVGVWPNVDAACQRTVHLTGSTQPQSQDAARYEDAYAYYRQLYPALKTIAHGLSEQQG